MEISGLFVWDDSVFGVASGAKGVRLILTPGEAQAVRSRQRRWQEPKPPPIQVMLKQAYHLRARLDATPGLSRARLAKEIGMNPSYLTRILNLLKLAPEIQQYIQELPPSLRKGLITESKLKHVARIPSYAEQLRLFENLMVMMPRGSCQSTTEGRLVPCL
ncbi:MAG: hypothetical protein LHV69_05775 [Elusimicrobia bacterium]|nr:hypothetical protein [Candidatus Obscuribacterium magneticum]